MSTQSGADLFKSMTGLKLGSKADTFEASLADQQRYRDSHDEHIEEGRPLEAAKDSARSYFLGRQSDALRSGKTLQESSFKQTGTDGQSIFLLDGTMAQIQESLKIAQSIINAPRLPKGRGEYEKAQFHKAALDHEVKTGGFGTDWSQY
jgi:hypothetical protein